MAEKKNQWVSPQGEKWIVHAEGNTNHTERFDTQREAIDRARDIAKKLGSEVIVQGQDGEIRSRDSHGNDPYPPRDTQH